jgi:PAS domain S-box-containing protein
MNPALAAAIREEFDAVRDRWVSYLLGLEGTPYRDRPREELNETVERGLEAWVQALEGHDEALCEFVHFIVQLRMSLGFPLAEVHRAIAGFRVVIAPLIAARYTDTTAALQAYSDAAAVCDRCTLLLSQEWQRAATEALTGAGEQSEERAARLEELNRENRILAQRLSDTLSRAQAILRAVDSAILSVDTDCRIVFANDRVRDLLGVEPREILGRDKREVIARRIKGHFRHPDAFEQRLLWLNEHMEEEAVDELETIHPAQRWLRRYSAPVRDDSGALLGRLTIYTDITGERRRQEILEETVFDRTRELQALGRQLVERERLAAIGELAATIAHELRNPLGVISNATYLLRRKLGSDASLAKTIETLESHIQRCSRVISDLLDFVRARPLRLASIDPQALVRDVLREHPIPDRIRVVTEIAPELPDVVADLQLLEQAISNLIANALKAMPEPDAGALTVTCRPAPGGVEFAVADQGTGMTDEVRARVFEPLFTTSHSGTGLGLPLVKRIAESHDGSVSLVSAPGAGTTVTLFLPSPVDIGSPRRHGDTEKD